MNYKDFFSNLGFNFKSDLENRIMEFEQKENLSKKLKNSVLFYKSPNNTNTSFYLITTELNSTEIEDIRKYIWNKNDADLIFYYPGQDAKLVMFYAKYSPKISNEESKLDTFSTSEKDLEKIEQIKLWKFDSGVFWLNYSKFITKAKYKGIDKELVNTLNALRDQLNVILSKLILDKTECNKTVQALIDRTLYIKYLEDKHIINSRFYDYYFKDASLNYQKILENHSDADVNKLFKIIHEIFNNNLFEQPTIDDKYLTNEIRSLIATSFKANTNSGQLRLFDFQFDVLPVEFISYIYEVFLSEKQKENGIYYTPKKLAQLIVDEVINEDRIGSILDPSSGSGMFLIVAYQRLLEIARKLNQEPSDSISKIKFRTKLLTENIFGIEKELTAQRFTIFSLSLQIFEGINPVDIKEFIANELSKKGKVDLFSDFSFFENIKHANSLSALEKAFDNKHFSYLVGNPPFFEIPNTDEYKDEISFLNSYEVNLNNKEKKLIAKNIVGRYQISQCFFLKIKDWSNENTRFGFVSNSSNFYNDKSEKFQEYFYSNYGIEKIYELSRVKKILFEKANESVVAIIFTNNIKNVTIEYYPVDLGLFSEKPFELLIIQEDKSVQISQEDILKNKIRLRDYLVGNEFDRQLISKITDNSFKINHLALKDNKGKVEVHSGFKIWAEDARKKEYGIEKKIWSKISKQERERLRFSFYSKYFSKTQSQEHTLPYIEYKELSKFKIKGITSFISNITNFDRPRHNIYGGEKILLSRFGGITAVFSNNYLFFNTDILTLRLKNNDLIHLTIALLNSHLASYFLQMYLKKRVDGKFSKIGVSDIKQVPIPKDLDHNLATQISQISKDLSEGKFEFSEKEIELNELIYELYELTFWEKQRVKDYFLSKEKIGRKRNKLEIYKDTLKDVLRFYLKNSIKIEETPTDFNLIVVKISLNSNSDTPKADATKKFILNEVFENNPNGNFLASQEKIFGEDCVYIIKEDINTNWSETKAFEDGQDILKHIIPSEDGERIH
ncbi:N-6 DNA methylase [Flavobacterium sp. XS2P24]|uniref:N-6 DNA methylase n=1 Tax=Flavobacterium sp. XS2P24 TaxID=3041249 RepID=UPI0024A805ED|nr:N-6 DNA methylase [Flavobacterium sp. XS2P24]MDI6050451.1 N-6 DNA methylase [Flavobacterium sp. XS2P24]